MTSGTYNYGYDRKGNRVSSSNYETFVYDDENQLIQYRYEPPAPGLRTDFVSDARWRLHVRREHTGTAGTWTLASTTVYLYDGMRVVQERNAANTPQVTYTRGLDLSGSWEGAGVRGAPGSLVHGAAQAQITFDRPTGSPRTISETLLWEPRQPSRGYSARHRLATMNGVPVSANAPAVTFGGALGGRGG